MSFTSKGHQMHARHSFEDLARALAESGRLDEIVLALARFGAGRPVTDRDKAAIASAVSYLETITAELQDESTSPTIRAAAKASTASLDPAAVAGTAVTPSEWAREIGTLLTALQSLVSGGKPQKDAIDKLRAFFGRTLQANVERVDAMLKPSPSFRPQLT